MHSSHDVLIVGAGPAGSSLALLCARSGLSVALLERRRFPRHKACGEFLAPECLPLLEELGVARRLEALGASEVRGMRLFGHGRRVHGRFTQRAPSCLAHDHGVALRREVLDAVLLDAARAEANVACLERWTARSLLWDERGTVDGVLARHPSGEERPLRARFTVGADGLRSGVARALGVHRERPRLAKLALVTRYEGVDLGGEAEVHFFDGGYFAVCPVEGGRTSLNLVVERSALGAAGCGAEAFLERTFARAPELAERFEHARRVDPVRGLTPLAARTTRQTFDGAALLGDACGYVDPVTGEGLYFALFGAASLARCLAEAIRQGRRDRGALLPYRRARRREIAPRIALALALQEGLRHPRVVKGTLRLLEARPRLADLLLGVTGASLPLGRLARPGPWLAAAHSPRRER